MQGFRLQAEDHGLSADHERSEASQDLEVAKLIADFFQKSYFISATPAVVCRYHINSFDIFGSIMLSELEIFSALFTLQFNCLAGSNGIPSCILKNCAAVLCTPLMRVFNNSLRMEN